MEHPKRLYQFQLAERLGCTVGELQQRMSHAELIEWMAYDRNHRPIEHHYLAQICSTIANYSLGRNKLSHDKFLFKHARPRKEQTYEQREDAFRAVGDFVSKLPKVYRKRPAPKPPEADKPRRSRKARGIPRSK